MTKEDECPCIAVSGVTSYFLWREPPKGTGETVAIIIPTDSESEKAYNKNLTL